MSPALYLVFLRYESGPESVCWDSVLQINDALAFVVEGKNPYAENYFNFSMAVLEGVRGGVGDSGSFNPALLHFAYPPMMFLSNLPLYLVFRDAVGFYDARILNVVLLVLFVFFVRRLVSLWWRFITLFLIPFAFFPYEFGMGVNDVVPLFWVCVCVFLLFRGCFGLSSFFLGLGVLSKQTALVFVPFFLLFVFFECGGFARGFVSFFRLVFPLFFVFFVVLLPFLLWDFFSFVDDTFFYLTGLSDVSYPQSTA